MSLPLLSFPARSLAAAAACLTLIAGCGNRVDHDRVVAVGNGYGPVDVVPSTQPGSAPAGATSAEGATPPAAAPVADGPVAAGVDAPGGRAAPGVRTSGTRPVATPAARGAARPAACAHPLAPIVLGQTLASSGLVGAAIGGIRNGTAVWAKDVNARGGVQCHPVRLIQLDDGSDPARVTANWNQMVHDQGAVAMVGAGVPIAMAALRTAAERDRVPVVGGDVTAVDWVQSPYLFPMGGAPLTAVDGGTIEAVKIAPKPAKAGIFYCVEAAICTDLKNNFPKGVDRAGAALGPVLAVSLTQPDFTSECQTMKAAGVNVIFLGLDGSAGIRAARSCASLDYYPVMATGSLSVSAAAAADPGLRRNRSFMGSGLVPYTTSDSPGIQAFHAAMSRWAPTAAQEQQSLLGWAAGKLFEAALAQVSAKARAGDVTTAMVLDGLWQLKGETLDGLGPGATFTKNAPAKAIDCYYGLRLDDTGFHAVNGSTPTCFGADKKLEDVATRRTPQFLTH